MSLIPNTYNGLVSAVKALAEDDSLEFQNYIPTAIHLAEENLIKRLDKEDLTVETTVTAVAGTQTIARPSGERFVNDLWYTTSTGKQFPILRTNDYIRDYWPVTTSTSVYPNGTPKYYAIEGSNFVLAPIPASAYSFTVRDVQQVTHLSASNQTNFFTDFCSDALFYGTMVGMSEFMKDYAVLPVWQQRYLDAVEGLNNESRRERRDDSIKPNNPKGGENTLLGDN